MRGLLRCMLLTWPGGAAGRPQCLLLADRGRDAAWVSRARGTVPSVPACVPAAHSLRSGASRHAPRLLDSVTSGKCACSACHEHLRPPDIWCGSLQHQAGTAGDTESATLLRAPLHRPGRPSCGCMLWLPAPRLSGSINAAKVSLHGLHMPGSEPAQQLVPQARC